MSTKIKQIRERLDEIASQKSKFHLKERHESRHCMPRERAMTHSFVQASEVIGRDDDKENIIRLLQDSSDISVIPIVGIGGLGKTALTKLVYNDAKVKNHFQLQIWVCVSEEFDIKILTEKIIKSTEVGKRYGVESLSKMEMEQLQEILRESIGDKKYLLILDDVWNDDPMKWNQLKELLCMGANGSKILVTTRSNKVASIMGTIPRAYELSGLPDDECVALFTKCAFKEGQVKRYPNLLNIGVEIVKKCKGVPLAVKTQASILLMNTDESYWKSIRDSELWKIEQKENDILPALRLSYEHLPVHLKKCFTCCSFYPKDYEFDHLELTQIWMAHGLLESTNQNEEMEDIGLRYFQELGSRSFFQDIEVTDDIFITCKMHDLVHDLALSLTQNEFLVITSRTTQISQNVRHLLFPNFTSLPQCFSTLLQGLNHVRTAIFRSDEYNLHRQSNLKICLSRFRYLRMLDLAHSQLEMPLDWLSALKHLRYVHVGGDCKIKKFPNSICKLQNLQTLMLHDVIIEELPSQIRYLINLRFLIFSTGQKCLPTNGIGCLTSLRFLLIGNSEKLEHLFEDMQGLKHLRTLVIAGCERLVSLPQSMKYLTALETLVISYCENLNLTMDEGKDNQDLARFSLQKLILKELPRLVEFPEWLLQGSIDTLQFLKLESCKYLKRLPACLQNITSLQQLEIAHCKELRGKCEHEKGEDWSKIAHVAKIVINGSDINSADS